MQSTPLEQKIRGMIEPSLSALGYNVLVLRLKDGGKRRSLEVIAERTDSKGMTVDDCADISHTVSALLDVEDPISGAYQLEVSSPGLDRPLADLKDYERFTGEEAKIETALPLDGRKRFRGILKGVKENEVLIVVDGVQYALDYANIRTAKLVLTDALLKKTMANT